MSLDVTRRSGFILRMLSLVAFFCMILFAGIVVIQNDELGKIIPPSTERTLSIFFAYIVVMITFNYALAVKGRNFMGWKNEALIMIGFILVFVGMFLPHAFPTSELVVTESWIPFSSTETEHLKANWAYAPIAILSIPFFYKAWIEIRAMPLWTATGKYGE
ncbi:MAG: hypothetical protein R6V39_11420 [Desulfovibrionales bacterium]